MTDSSIKAWAALVLLAAWGLNGVAAKDLIPKTPGTVPNYWCAWAAQNYQYGQGLKELDPTILEGSNGGTLARASLNEKSVLGPEGWVNFYPKVRGDLLFILDDGWDVPAENFGPWISSFNIDGQKFPAFAALPPGERLKQLSARIKAAGWRGLGVWVAAQESEAAGKDLTVEQYWKQRMQWCKAAGITYWKVDWGKKSGDTDFRRWLTALARKEYPELIVEHCAGHGPFNETPRVSVPWADLCKLEATFADVVRLYDISPQLGIPSMLDRVAHATEIAQAGPGTLGLLNCDDEPVIAASLGVCMGVMRHPMAGLRPGKDPDLFMNGPRQQKQRLDEVVRAVRWQRLSPPWAVGSEKVLLDPKLLTDSWDYQPGDFWDGIGQHIEQSAPARVARGLALPEVKAEGDLPYVAVSRNLNGAVTVATMGRVSREKGWRVPLADVTLPLDHLPPAIGIFGHYRTLTLTFATPIPVGRVWAQDLAGDQAVDVTSRIDVDPTGAKVTLPGALIDQLGLAAATPGDVSDPGLVLVWEAAAGPAR